MYCYTGLFAGVRLNFLFRHPDTAKYYKDYIKEDLPREDFLLTPENDVSGWMDLWKAEDPAYAEYVISCSYACDRLMKEGRVVFHGAAVLLEDRVFLFTGPSGVGKTTQVRWWQALYSTQILNGDKPIFEVGDSGEVLVHPSPWKGKEDYGRDDITAPLGGIIVLRQAPENRIERLEPADAAKELFCRIYSTFNTEQEVLDAARILEKILSKTPVWLLRNRGDEASTRMTWETLQKEGGLPCATD